MKKVKYKILENFEKVIDADETDDNSIKNAPNFATLPYNASLLKLGHNLQTTLENRGYHIEKDKVDSCVGSHGDQIQDVTIQFFGRKRKDVQGKIGEERSTKPLWICVIGLVLWSISALINNFALILLSWIIIGLGVYVLIKAPKVETYTYTPTEMGIWILGKGYGIQGTRRNEIKEASEGSSHAKRFMESIYIQAEANLKLGADYEQVDGLYTERILLDEDKKEVSIIDLIKGMIQKKEKITLQDEAKYQKLVKDEDTIKKDLSEDFKELKETLKKFS
jgi:hypothetical protein